jgi:hypothetical protein
MASQRYTHHGHEEGGRVAQHETVPRLLFESIAKEVSVLSGSLVLGLDILGKLHSYSEEAQR